MPTMIQWCFWEQRIQESTCERKAYNPGQVSEVFFIIEPRRCQINQFIQNWHQIVVNHHSAFQYTLWLFNIAMENGHL